MKKKNTTEDVDLWDVCGFAGSCDVARNEQVIYFLVNDALNDERAVNIEPD